MNRFYIILFCFLISAELSGQFDTAAIYGVTPQQEAEYKKWIDNLYEMGVVINGDSIYISEESQKAAIDTQFRRIVYPSEYRWTEAQYLFKQMHLKIGFWYLINLYKADPANKEQVLKFILSFDRIFEMDKVMTSVFYTYGLLDPLVATIVNGKPDIRHPEIVEQKLAKVKEIVNYIIAYRVQQEKEKK